LGPKQNGEKATRDRLTSEGEDALIACLRRGRLVLRRCGSAGRKKIAGGDRGKGTIYASFNVIHGQKGSYMGEPKHHMTM